MKVALALCMKQSFWVRHRVALVIACVAALAAASLIPSPTKSIAAFAYEFVRGCPDKSDAKRPSEFLIIGHRGAAGHAIENTLPSLEKGLRLGANALEIDLCMTRDSAIVLWHDWMPDDPIATSRQHGAEPDVLYKPVVPDDDSPWHRAVNLLSLDELRAHYGYAHVDSSRRVEAHVPTLEEVLAWSKEFSGLKVLYLDIKVPDDSAALGPAMIARIEKLIASNQPAFDVVYLVGAETVFDAVERMLPDGNISMDAEPPPGMVLDPCSYGSVRYAIEHGNRNASLIIPVASTFAPWATARRIARCDVERSAGRVQFVIGTTNDPDRLACLIGIGVDGIFVDYPERLKELVGGEGQTANVCAGR